jgi:serine/threonine protein kinase
VAPRRFVSVFVARALLFLVVDELKSWIGRGSFGDVLLYEHVSTKTLCAVKKVPVEGWKSTDRPGTLSKEWHREVVPMASVSSQFVVSLYDAFQRGPYVHIIMEHCEKGNLRQYLKEREESSNPLNEAVCSQHILAFLT